MIKANKGEQRRQIGGQTSLLEHEEQYIVQCIKTASVWGCPIDAFDLRMVIHNYLEQKGKTIKKFRNNIPGRDFVMIL